MPLPFTPVRNWGRVSQAGLTVLVVSLDFFEPYSFTLVEEPGPVRTVFHAQRVEDVVMAKDEIRKCPPDLVVVFTDGNGMLTLGTGIEGDPEPSEANEILRRTLREVGFRGKILPAALVLWGLAAEQHPLWGDLPCFDRLDGSNSAERLRLRILELLSQ